MSNKKISFSTFGFTLIELLIAIAIVGIIAVVAFVALDPARRFAEARNATRWTDVAALLDAIKLYQVDQRGTPPWPVTIPPPASAANRVAENGIRYMIGTCDNAVAGSECFGGAAKVCAGAPTGSVNGVYGIPLTLLTTATPAYLAVLPISQPIPGTAAWSAVRTGYYLIQNTTSGGTEIGACDEDPVGGVAPNIAITK